MESTWIGIVTYNEAENLPLLLERIRAQTATAHIVIVDDNSPDGTGKIADARAAEDDLIHVIHREGKQGYSSAQLAALKLAEEEGAEIFVTMDADLSHAPESVEEMVKALSEADVAIGSRYVPGGKIEGWGFHRLFLSAVGNWAYRLIGGLPAKDNTSGYRAYRIEAAKRLGLGAATIKGYAFLPLSLRLCQREGFRIAEVPITFVDRQYGETKMSGAIIWEHMGLLWRLFLGRWGVARRGQ